MQVKADIKISMPGRFTALMCVAGPDPILRPNIKMFFSSYFNTAQT